MRGFKDKEDYENVNPKLLISTPELLKNFSFGKRIILLDEFHLYFYWGETFREGLLDFIEEHLYYSPKAILLSATISEDIKTKMRDLFSSCYNEIRVWNFGNQVLRKQPESVQFYFSKNSILKSLFFEKTRGTSLVFCQYRQEVKHLEKLLILRGFKAISCVGGEAFEFSIRLNEQKQWDFIIATTVVSHGVNLPAISRIYFTYKVKNLDFYLQMVGRAGRDGSPFEVHTLSFLYFSKVLMLKGVWMRFIKSFGQRWRYLLYSYYES